MYTFSQWSLHDDDQCDHNFYTMLIRAREALRQCLPDQLKDGTFSNCLKDDASTKRWLSQLMKNLQDPTLADPRGIPLPPWYWSNQEMDYCNSLCLVWKQSWLYSRNIYVVQKALYIELIKFCHKARNVPFKSQCFQCFIVITQF